MLANKVKCPTCGIHVAVTGADVRRVRCPDCGAAIELHAATMQQRPMNPPILQSRPFAPPGATMPAVEPTLPPQIPMRPAPVLWTPPPPAPTLKAVVPPVTPTVQPATPPLLPAAPVVRARGRGIWFMLAGVALLMLGALALVLQEMGSPTNATQTAQQQTQLPTPPAEVPTPPLPPPEPVRELTEEERQVNATIDKGVAFLRTRYQKEGTFDNSHHVTGLAALPAMTLLECGVPTSDEQVQGAAKFVRANTKQLTNTYDLALCILFLDRLGEPQDKALIRTLSLRLLAGQTPGGGWAYYCPLLEPADEDALERALKSLPKLDWTPQSLVINETDKPVPPPAQPTPDTQPLFDLPPKVKPLPVVQKLTADAPAPKWDSSDNSNTQFAILGVWTARRHNIPVDRSLALIDRRFRALQHTSGGWSYVYDRNAHPTPSMTCAGLLGLAVGYGRKQQPTEKTVQHVDNDTAIANGLKALAQHVPAPAPKGTRPGGQLNIYFLWSVERVGVLYGIKEIGDRDWYAWGSQLLVSRQNPQNGSWRSEDHSGAEVCDTSLALLFLKRVNFLSDLPTKFKVK